MPADLPPLPEGAIYYPPWHAEAPHTVAIKMARVLWYPAGATFSSKAPMVRIGGYFTPDEIDAVLAHLRALAREKEGG